MSQPTERMYALAERGLPAQQRAANISGRVSSDRGGPLLVYTDGSVSQQRIGNGLGWMTGWGYLDTHGRYGCGKMPQFAKTGTDSITVAELRAIWHAIGDRLETTRCTVITDCAAAIAFLDGWRAGKTRMPSHYVGRSAGEHRIATLEQLRQVVAAHPDNLTLKHTRGHAGDILNEAADTLARLGARWSRDGLTKPQVRERAHGVADGFLAQWRRR